MIRKKWRWAVRATVLISLGIGCLFYAGNPQWHKSIYMFQLRVKGPVDFPWGYSGMRRDYYKNGQIKFEGYVVGSANTDLPHERIYEGKVTWWHENGKIKKEQYFEDGLPTGTWTSRDLKSNRVFTTVYSNNVEILRYSVLRDPDGTEVEEDRQDNLTGIWTRTFWHGNGVMASLEWAMGDNTQRTTTWYINGATQSLKILTEDKFKHTTWDVDGKVTWTEERTYDRRPTSLDMSSDPGLTYLECDCDRLTNLNVTANTNLTQLNCKNNSLTSLDVSECTKLVVLICRNNKLTNTLDLSANTNLWSVNASGNLLTEIIVADTNNLPPYFHYDKGVIIRQR